MYSVGHSMQVGTYFIWVGQRVYMAMHGHKSLSTLVYILLLLVTIQSW